MSDDLPLEPWEEALAEREKLPSRLECLMADPGDHADPLDTIDDRLDLIALFDQLRLTPRQRAVALLRAAGYTAEETAAKLGCSRRTVVSELAALRLSFTRDGSHPAGRRGGSVKVVAHSGCSRDLLVGGTFFEGERMSGINTIEGLEQALAEGSMTRCLDPAACVVEGGRDHAEGAVYVVLRPGDYTDELGRVSRLHAGDVLTSSEARHAGAALRRLCLQGDLAEIPSSRGVFLLWQAARDRALRAEGLLGWAVASEEAA